MNSVLLQPFYVPDDEHRRSEYFECLGANILSTAIDKIVLFVEKGFTDFICDDKISYRETPQRPTFQEIIDYSNEYLQGELAIMANTDIYFDESSNLHLLKNYPMNDKLLCLSRYDVKSDGTCELYNWSWAQDAWIFVPKLKYVNAPFYFGVPACDNRFPYEAAQSGINVLNPALTIKPFHIHSEGKRTYSEANRLNGNVMHVYIDELC